MSKVELPKSLDESVEKYENRLMSKDEIIPQSGEVITLEATPVVQHRTEPLVELAGKCFHYLIPPGSEMGCTAKTIFEQYSRFQIAGEEDSIKGFNENSAQKAINLLVKYAKNCREQIDIVYHPPYLHMFSQSIVKNMFTKISSLHFDNKFTTLVNLVDKKTHYLDSDMKRAISHLAHAAECELSAQMFANVLKNNNYDARIIDCEVKRWPTSAHHSDIKKYKTYHFSYSE